MFGLVQRVPVTTLNFPSSSPQPGTYRVVDAFPSLSFSGPLFLTHAPGDRDRLFVLEQRGTIQVFANSGATTTKKTFLDIQARVLDGGERGLLGLAFDPDYATNGFFYVYYSATTTTSGMNHRSIVARYRVSATDPDAADPASESILLQFDQPFGNHNGGCLGFGPDGHLYIASGDGGSGGDPQGNGQKLTTLLGKILRVTTSGGVAAGNPFAGMGGGVRGEIWAYGLRNPWRFSFDRDTGDLWCGDVGQGALEEIDLIVEGGNYGWNIFEGDRNYDNPGGIDINTTDRPVHVYGRSLGASVTGGYVYRGGDVPSLRGAYVYGDFISGNIWALVHDGTGVVSNTLIADIQNPASFGEDADGELFICSFDGSIYRLEEVGGGGGGPFPALLSDTGLFSNVATLAPAPGVTEYEVNAELWSDGARKRRWIALPGTTRIGFHATEAWDFPIGAVLVKHFELDTVSGVERLETRVLIREDTGWHGYTYRWNAAQTDAVLLAGAETADYDVPDAAAPGGVRTQTWYFPSRTDCLSCHTDAAGHVLGVRTRQLNRDFDYPAMLDNQLRSWNHVAFFTTDIGDHGQYDALPDPADPAAPATGRARAYLDANCAMCHRPGGPTPVTIDLRYGIASSTMGIVDVVPTAGDLGLTNARLVAPGSKETSTLWERMRRLDATRMPPLASSVVDATAVDVIGVWIDSGNP
jgi:uncharacterized repeat protein (TIGR03806 family)